MEFSETPDFNSPVIEKAENSYNRCMRPNLLKIGTKYFWRVKAKKQNGEIVVSNVRSFTTAENTPRMIGIPSNNMRDIGGGKNAEGIRVRQGLIYRGIAPQAGRRYSHPHPNYRTFYLLLLTSHLLPNLSVVHG